MNDFNTSPVTFQVVKNETACRQIWEHLISGREIDDEWDFRYIFYRYLGIPLHFIVASVGAEPVALLALQFNSGKGVIPKSFGVTGNFLEFFGGDDTDSNAVIVKPGFEDLVPTMLKQVDQPAVLAPLAESYTVGESSSQQYTNRYLADLKDMSELEDFLKVHFDSKGRGKLMQQLSRLHRNAAVEIEPTTDLQPLFQFNIDRFGSDSSFSHPYRRQVFRDLMERYQHDAFRVSVDGRTVAVSFALIYKNHYLGMNVGYDYSVRDLGKFVICQQIERAIQLSCDVYDSGKGDGGWKEQFHLQKIPQYMLTI